MNEEETCNTCRFIHQKTCRRYPPQPLADRDGDHCSSEYPDVLDTAWCGEWQDKNAQELIDKLRDLV